MPHARVIVDGRPYEASWLSPHARASGRGCGLHVVGPLDGRSTRGYRPDSEGDWTDDSGPQGRLDTPHYRRWWNAAGQLLAQYLEWMDEHADEIDHERAHYRIREAARDMHGAEQYSAARDRAHARVQELLAEHLTDDHGIDADELRTTLGLLNRKHTELHEDRAVRL